MDIALVKTHFSYVFALQGMLNTRKETFNTTSHQSLNESVYKGENHPLTEAFYSLLESQDTVYRLLKNLMSLSQE